MQMLNDINEGVRVRVYVRALRVRACIFNKGTTTAHHRYDLLVEISSQR